MFFNYIYDFNDDSILNHRISFNNYHLESSKFFLFNEKDEKNSTIYKHGIFTDFDENNTEIQTYYYNDVECSNKEYLYNIKSKI